MRKEPRNRYDSAAALAEDLRRFAAGEPILARRAGPLERLLVWCRRRPAVTLLALLLILSVAGGFAGVLWKWRDAEYHKQQARQAEQCALAREQATAQALTYVSASAVADTFKAFNGRTSLLAQVGKRPQAIRTLQRSCSLGEQLLDDNSHPRLPLSLVEQYAQLAVFQAAAGQRDEAIASCRRGLELLDRLTATDRTEVADPKTLALTCFLLGGVLMNLHRPEEAVHPFEQAIQLQRVVFEQDTTDRTRRKALSHFYFHLAHVQRQAGRVDDSAATSRAPKAVAERTR